MGTQIETTIYDHTGTPEQITVKVTSDGFAAAFAEVCHDDWQRSGWREELFTTGRDSSIQCLYDSRGIIWQTNEYRRLDPVPEGYVTLV